MMVQIQERDAELRGEKRGELRGIAIGEKRGILNTRIENAKAMLTSGLAVDMVSRFSGLPIEQVLTIKAQLAANWPFILPPFVAKMDDEWRHVSIMVQIQERNAKLRGQGKGVAIGSKCKFSDYQTAVAQQFGCRDGNENVRPSYWTDTSYKFRLAIGWVVSHSANIDANERKETK